MRKRLAVALVLLALTLAVVGCATPQASTAPPVAEEKASFDAVTLYEKAASATWTVLVNTVDGWWAKGSGFSVRKPTQVLTAYHVVKDYKEFRLVDWTGYVTYTAKVVRFDKDADVALLEITDGPKLTAYLTLADNRPKVGEEVALISSPITNPEKAMGFIPSVLTTGRVAKYSNNYLVTEAFATHGSSGGAVIDNQGNVAGLEVALTGVESGFTLAVPASVLVSFLAGK